MGLWRVQLLSTGVYCGVRDRDGVTVWLVLRWLPGIYSTEGAVERYFVQREISEAFQLRKPFMLMYETDDRFGRPDFRQEMKAKRQKGRDGQYLLTEEQIAWLFGEVVGIPVRREAHELSGMLDEIETHARNAIQDKPGKAKVPPPELCTEQQQAPTETETSVSRVDEDGDETEPLQQPNVDWETVSRQSPAEWSTEAVSTWLRERLELPEVATAALQEAVDGSLALEMDSSMWRHLGAEGLTPAKITRDLKALQGQT